MFITLGLYGTAVHLPSYNTLINISPQTGSGSGVTNSISCIFSENSRLYPENVRLAFRPFEDYIPSCNDLNNYWTYLIGIMSLCFIAIVISFVAVITNCITPCVEDRYSNVWRPKTPED